MKNGVKMSDIAEVLGISKMTVSNALAGRTGVSQELREKIKKQRLRWDIHSNKPQEIEVIQ